MSSGGTEFVFNGGIAQQAFVSSGGLQFVAAGGVASVTHVGSGGSLKTLGITWGTEVFIGGQIFISSGAVASDTFVSGGRVVLGSGASIVGLFGSGTLAIASGMVETNYTVNGSWNFEVLSGATVSGATKAPRLMPI